MVLAPKMCPDQSQAFKEGNNSQVFTSFSERAAFQAVKGMFVQSFAQIFEEPIA